MKKLIFLLSMLCFYTLKAQIAMPPNQTDIDLMEARKYLLGIGRPKDTLQALVIYTNYANNHNNEKAINSLGLMYKDGVGVKNNFIKAKTWLTIGENLNYKICVYNLGMLFKEDTTGNQNFSTAYNYYKKAMNLGHDQSEYCFAYMHYKGLGCQQNYDSAFLHFKNGADKGRSNSIYFLALCYRNGYGTPINETLANTMLNASSAKGYNLAAKEQKIPYGENSNPKVATEKNLLPNFYNADITNINNFKKIDQNINATAIAGKFEGYIVKYDWSGKNIVDMRKLKFELINDKGDITGNWQYDDSITIPIKAKYLPTHIEFLQTNFKRTDHYSQNKPKQYSFEKASISYSEANGYIYLIGNINMFSKDRNEPEKPTYIVLRKKIETKDKTAPIKINTHNNNSPAVSPIKINTVQTDNSTLTNNIINSVAFPNPFNNTLMLKFNLQANATINIAIINTKGQTIINKKLGTLNIGLYSYQINTDKIMAGNYIIKIQANDKIETINIVKQ